MSTSRASQSGVRALALVALPSSCANARFIQFGVAELPGEVDPINDSYVIVIDESETALLDHARALVDWVAAGGDPAKSPGAAEAHHRIGAELPYFKWTQAKSKSRPTVSGSTCR